MMEKDKKDGKGNKFKYLNQLFFSEKSYQMGAIPNDKKSDRRGRNHKSPFIENVLLTLLPFWYIPHGVNRLEP